MMPRGQRRAYTTVCAALWGIALTLNVAHVYEHLGQAHMTGTQRGILAVAPDVLLLMGVWRLRWQRRHPVAWLMVGSGLTWLVWAGLSVTRHIRTDQIVTLAPVGVALMVTMALELTWTVAPTVAQDPSVTSVSATAVAPTVAQDPSVTSVSATAVVPTVAQDPVSRPRVAAASVTRPVSVSKDLVPVSPVQLRCQCHECHGDLVSRSTYYRHKREAVS